MKQTTNKQWQFIFIMLIVFTYVVLGSVFNSTSKAFAEVIKQQNQNNNGGGTNKLIVFNDDDNSSGPLNKLIRLYNDNVLCTVNQTELDYFSSITQTSKETLTIDGKQIELVRVFNSKNVSKKDIIDYLKKSGTYENKCETIKSHKWFFLSFNAHMS